MRSLLDGWSLVQHGAAQQKVMPSDELLRLVTQADKPALTGADRSSKAEVRAIECLHPPLEQLTTAASLATAAGVTE
jgi:hypothetical protein